MRPSLIRASKHVGILIALGVSLCFSWVQGAESCGAIKMLPLVPTKVGNAAFSSGAVDSIDIRVELDDLPGDLKDFDPKRDNRMTWPITAGDPHHGTPCKITATPSDGDWIYRVYRLGSSHKILVESGDPERTGASLYDLDGCKLIKTTRALFGKPNGIKFKDGRFIGEAWCKECSRKDNTCECTSASVLEPGDLCALVQNEALSAELTKNSTGSMFKGTHRIRIPKEYQSKEWFGN